MRQVVAATLAASCLTGPLAADPTNTALETLGNLINWSGAVGSAPRNMTGLSVGFSTDEADCVLFFDVSAEENGGSFDMRLSAQVTDLDPNKIYIWDDAGTQRMDIAAPDGSDKWTFLSQIRSTDAFFDDAQDIIASGDNDGSCTPNLCTLRLDDNELNLPLPSLTSEDDIVATTVALQTLITQCGGSADTADN